MTFFSFILRFWNHIFTWRSLRFSLWDSSHRLGFVMYVLPTYSFSNSAIWNFEYGFRFLRMCSMVGGSVVTGRGVCGGSAKPTNENKILPWRHVSGVACQITDKVSVCLCRSAIQILYEENPPVTGGLPVNGGFPSQRASNAEIVSMWGYHGVSQCSECGGNIAEVISHSVMILMNILSINITYDHHINHRQQRCSLHHDHQ